MHFEKNIHRLIMGRIRLTLELVASFMIVSSSFLPVTKTTLNEFKIRPDPTSDWKS